MKIRAKLPSGNYFVEVTNKELGNILGEYSLDNELQKSIEKSISTEIDISISNLYMKSYELKLIMSYSNVKEARKKLQYMLDYISEIEDTVAFVNNKFQEIILDKVKDK